MSGDRCPSCGRCECADSANGRGRAPEMAVDFSRVNVHYLIQAREVARRYPGRAPVLLGATERHTALLAEVPAEAVSHLARVRVPLIVPRQSSWWWLRLLKALADGHPGELESVLEHVELTAIR